MERKNIEVKVNNDSWLSFVVGVILVMGLFGFVKTDKVYDEEFFIKPEYDKALIISKGDDFIYGKTILVRTNEGKIKPLFCTDLHWDLSDVSNMMISVSWETAFKDF